MRVSTSCIVVLAVLLPLALAAVRNRYEYSIFISLHVLAL